MLSSFVFFDHEIDLDSVKLIHHAKSRSYRSLSSNVIIRTHSLWTNCFPWTIIKYSPQKCHGKNGMKIYNIRWSKYRLLIVKTAETAVNGGVQFQLVPQL